MNTLLRRLYTDDFTPNSLPSFPKESPSTGLDSAGRLTNVRVRGKKQAHPAPSEPNPVGSATYPASRDLTETAAPTRVEPASDEASIQSPSVDALGTDILQLLRKGESVTQIAVQLQVSKTLVKRWQRQFTTPDFQKTDKRRLYDDAFKQIALQQISQGVSVRQLSTTMDVSQVTLHKWKNQAALHRNRGLHQKREASASTPLESSTGQPDSLHQQLLDLQEERDILVKALVILLRAS